MMANHDFPYPMAISGPPSWISRKFRWVLKILDPQSAYLVGGIPTPLKNMSSSVGMIFPFPTVSGKSLKKIQTTNQYKLVYKPLKSL